MNYSKADTQEKFEAAVASLEENVQLYVNVMECCSGCVNLTEVDGEKPWAYHFGGQGNEIAFDRFGIAYLQEEDEEWEEEDEDGDFYTETQEGRQIYKDVIAYFNHGAGAGELVKAAFENVGFEVEWDGTENHCVIVKLS